MDEAAPALTARQERILGSVCRDYILRGQEVSSAELVRAHALSWSTATIRQELAVLEQHGLLQRPHRSAGVLPSREGMRLYVASLPKSPRPPEPLARAVDLSLRERGVHPERDLRGVSCVLSEVAGCVAVSFWATSRAGEIEDVDVVPLVGERALVVMTLDDRSTLMQPVALEGLAETPEAEGRDLPRLQSRLRALCRGRTLGDARRELAILQVQEEARLDRLLAEALRVALVLCSAAAFDPLIIQVAGQSLLAHHMAHASGGEAAAGPRLSDVLELLDDYHRLADVLCQLLPPPTGDAPPVAGVRVGVEGLVGVPTDLTLVGARLLAPGSAQGCATGAVALLGSDRMDYAAVIPLVEYAARTLAAH